MVTTTAIDPLTNGSDASGVVAEVRAFLTAHLPSDWAGIGALSADDAERFVDRWRATLARHRWLAPTWPERHGGRGIDSRLLPLVIAEFAEAGVPTGGPNDAQGIQMLGSTLLALGEDQLCDRFLRATLDGDITWAEGFSEPDAGSDLAAVRTTARLDGDVWRVSGQKVWTSNAETANWIFLLARTEPSAPKHRGLTFLLLPLEQPGVEVRPVRQMSGGAEFCEVYFDDALAAADDVVGTVNAGWTVALSLLAHERSGISATMPSAFSHEHARLVELARTTGRTRDPLVRQQLARAYTDTRLVEWLGRRASDAPKRAVAWAPLLKVQWTEHHQRSSMLGVDLLAADALVVSGRAPSSVFGPDERGASPTDAASWVGTMLNARSATIYAGTNEVNRNVIGEQLLGLPREPRALS